MNALVQERRTARFPPKKTNRLVEIDKGDIVTRTAARTGGGSARLRSPLAVYTGCAFSIALSSGWFVTTDPLKSAHKP